MKKIATKVQEMARKADEIRRVVEGVPPKIAEVREAVASTVGHVQKLRSELMTGLGTLRLENEAQLVESLREIDANVAVLREAGCRLERTDLDLGPTRKLVVHLRRVAEIDAERVRALQEANASKPTMRALLAALLKADELARGVELEELSYARLTVELGAYPSVRIGWMTEEAKAWSAGSGSLGGSVATAAVVAPAGTANVATPVFAQTNFFERRVPSEPAVERLEGQAQGQAVLETQSAATASAKAKEPGLKNAWGAEALARFKKMPDVRRA